MTEQTMTELALEILDYCGKDGRTESEIYGRLRTMGVDDTLAIFLLGIASDLEESA